MSDFGDDSGVFYFAGDFEGLIFSLIVTVITIVVCLVCTLVICCVRCSINSGDNGQGQLFSGGSILHRSPPNGHQRDVEYQMEQEEEENRERTREWDLSEAPPPAYRHVEEYKNVDLEHAEVVRLKQTMYRLSSHLEPETESLPPDYVSNRGEDEMSERVSISVAPQQTPEGELPPTYSTAQLELMARRTAMGPNTVTEMSIPIDEEESSTAEAFHLRSETPVQETLNAVMQ